MLVILFIAINQQWGDFYESSPDESLKLNNELKEINDEKSYHISDCLFTIFDSNCIFITTLNTNSRILIEDSFFEQCYSPNNESIIKHISTGEFVCNRLCFISFSCLKDGQAIFSYSSKRNYAIESTFCLGGDKDNFGAHTIYFESDDVKLTNINSSSNKATFSSGFTTKGAIQHAKLITVHNNSVIQYSIVQFKEGNEAALEYAMVTNNTQTKFLYGLMVNWLPLKLNYLVFANNKGGVSYYCWGVTNLVSFYNSFSDDYMIMIGGYYENDPEIVVENPYESYFENELYHLSTQKCYGKTPEKLITMLHENENFKEFVKYFVGSAMSLF